MTVGAVAMRSMPPIMITMPEQRQNPAADGLDHRQREMCTSTREKVSLREKVYS